MIDLVSGKRNGAGSAAAVQIGSRTVKAAVLPAPKQVSFVDYTVQVRIFSPDNRGKVDFRKPWTMLAAVGADGVRLVSGHNIQVLGGVPMAPQAGQKNLEALT